MIKRLILICCALTLAQCAPRKTTDGVPSLLPLEQSTTVTELAPYVDGVEFIPLEEGEASYLSYVRKMLVDRRGNFIVRDLSGTIKTFGSDGRFLFDVGRKGRGPGEYLKADDVALDPTGDNIIVLSLGRVLFYNTADGKFIRDVETPARDFEAICAAADGGFFLFSCNPAPEDGANFDKEFLAVTRFDGEGKQTGAFLSRKDYVLTEGIFTQSSAGGAFLRPQEGDNVLYKIAGDEIVPQYHIDFGARAIPPRYIYERGDVNDLQSLIRAPYHKIPIYFHDTDNLLYFATIGPGGYNNNFLYSLPEGRAVHWEDRLLQAPTLVMASDRDDLYVAVTGLDAFLELGDDELNPLGRVIVNEFKRQGLTLTSDNPLLVKIRFRV